MNIGLLGATGYAGIELVRLLLRHPYVKLAAVGSVSFEGQKLSDVYPSLQGLCDLVCEDADAVISKSDVVFAALPHGLSQQTAKDCIDRDKKFIDLGADFRLFDLEAYENWYGVEALYPDLHAKAVYGLPERYRAAIKGASLVANPGCYPTCSALALLPALENRLIDTTGIIIDAKSGVTGSGRAPTQGTHFPDCNESFSAYKVAEHRHTPEIEQTLSDAAGAAVTVTFVPHLLPVNRGILATVYAALKPGVVLEDVRNAYETAYKNEPFVRVRPEGQFVSLAHVRGSNYCDMQLYADKRTNRLIVTAVLDNMVKGAAGQAIQNLNLMCGFEETAGLLDAPLVF